MALLLSIGGCNVRLEGGETLRLTAELPGMAPFAVREPRPHAPTLNIRLDCPLALPECQWLHPFDIADGTVQCRFGIDAAGGYWYAFSDGALLHQREPRTVEANTIRAPWTLRFALWSAYAQAGLDVKVVPFHSSVVVCQGHAVLCLGESGTGKSTHTRLWLEHIAGTHLLNDDSPIVSLADGTLRAYGSPWSGKTDCYLAESHPIAGFLRIEQRPANSIRRLRTVEAFAALQPSCPPSLAHDERCMDRMVQFLSDVIPQVPVYRLGCLPDADAARLSHATLFPQP